MVVMFTSFFMVTSVFFMVTTVTVAVPAMMLVVVTMMMLVVVPMMTVMPVMAIVVTMMQQRAERYKSNRRTHDAVTMVGLRRNTGQRQSQRAAGCNQAQFVSCQVNHYYLPLYLVTPPI